MTSRSSVRCVGATLLAVAGITSGCGASDSLPAPDPVPPSISSISPSVGSTGGGTTVVIAGSGFQAGVTVTLGVERYAASVEHSGSIRVTTSPQNAGTFEVVVTNPNGQSARRPGGFTYALPQSFDFNGAWTGYALAHPDAQRLSAPAHSDMELVFTVEDGLLTSVTCGAVRVALPGPVEVKDGAFAYSGDGGVITGRIVSSVDAVGTINTDDCPATRWSARKR